MFCNTGPRCQYCRRISVIDGPATTNFTSSLEHFVKIISQHFTNSPQILDQGKIIVGEKQSSLICSSASEDKRLYKTDTSDHPGEFGQRQHRHEHVELVRGAVLEKKQISHFIASFLINILAMFFKSLPWLGNELSILIVFVRLFSPSKLS